MIQLRNFDKSYKTSLRHQLEHRLLLHPILPLLSRSMVTISHLSTIANVFLGSTSNSANPPDPVSILSALAAMAKNPQAAAPQPPQPVTSAYVNSTNSADPRVRNAFSPPQQISTPQSFPAPAPPQSQAGPVTNPLAALAALLPQAQQAQQPAVAAPAVDTQKLAIIQLLLQQGVPIEQVAAILNAQTQAQPQQLQPQIPQTYPLSPRGRRRDSRSRSPPPRRRSPSRSVSPPPARGRGRGRRRDSFDSPPPPRRRRSPSYDDYRGGSPSRSRSPPPARRRQSPTPRERSPLRKGGQGLPVVDERNYKSRFIEWDDSLKPDRIRGSLIPLNMLLTTVLSRTLFVGGITNRISEDKVRAMFSQFGGVQSIIMNPEKRCAFLKMYTREGAVNARGGMETYPTEDTTIRVPAPSPLLHSRPSTC